VLHLDATGASWVLIEIAVLVFLPYLAATLWPAIKAATTDPQDLLEKEFI
jgi:ABC-type lipoprotein release transport system permease subunit